MKNYAKIYEVVNTVLTNTKSNRIGYKKSFHSLSRLLKDTQTVEGFKFAKPIFEELGLPLTRKVKKSDVENLIQIWHLDKKGTKYPAYISKSIVYDIQPDGSKIEKKDAKGNTVYIYKLHAVKDGMWTIDTFVKVLGVNCDE